MISICIPVYNRDISALAAMLAAGNREPDIPWELLVADDGSTIPGLVERNKASVKAAGGIFLRSDSNKGRSFTRRMLAQQASRPYLVFLDADCMPVDPGFIEAYRHHLPADVICGGLRYREKLPVRNLRLHWKYGNAREVEAASRSLLTSNFCIRRELLAEMPEPVLPNGYGHEDTATEGWLAAKGITPLFISNPVFHDGLKEAPLFMTHQEQAVENLLFLAHGQPGSRLQAADPLHEAPGTNAGPPFHEQTWLQEHSPLLRALAKVEKAGILPLMRFIYRAIGPFLRRRLCKGWTSLRALDVYKLLYAARLREQRES